MIGVFAAVAAAVALVAAASGGDAPKRAVPKAYGPRPADEDPLAEVDPVEIAVALSCNEALTQLPPDLATPVAVAIGTSTDANALDLLANTLDSRAFSSDVDTLSRAILLRAGMCVRDRAAIVRALTGAGAPGAGGEPGPMPGLSPSLPSSAASAASSSLEVVPPLVMARPTEYKAALAAIDTAPKYELGAVQNERTAQATGL